jgi:hypothetical protein
LGQPVLQCVARFSVPHSLEETLFSPLLPTSRRQLLAVARGATGIAAKHSDGNTDLATRTACYLHWLLQQPPLLERARNELRGKRLGCWCAPHYCHGWVLAAIANCTDIEFQAVCEPCVEPTDRPPSALVQVAERLAAAETRVGTAGTRLDRHRETQRRRWVPRRSGAGAVHGRAAAGGGPQFCSLLSMRNCARSNFV